MTRLPVSRLLVLAFAACAADGTNATDGTNAPTLWLAQDQLERRITLAEAEPKPF